VGADGSRPVHRHRRSAPEGKLDDEPPHAAALALVGWYLMLPPTQEQLDSTCRGGPSVMDHVTALIVAMM
jgi:hypothetical protein